MKLGLNCAYIWTWVGMSRCALRWARHLSRVCPASRPKVCWVRLQLVCNECWILLNCTQIRNLFRLLFGWTGKKFPRARPTFIMGKKNSFKSWHWPHGEGGGVSSDSFTCGSPYWKRNTFIREYIFFKWCQRIGHRFKLWKQGPASQQADITSTLRQFPS